MQYRLNHQISTDNPFWVQYTSLMLIVLTFILAIFFAPDAFRKATRLEPIVTPRVGQMELSNLFNADDGAIDSQILEGIVFALSNHDLDATLYVYGPSREEALARSITIYKDLVGHGVPARAITSYGVTEDSPIQVKVEFYETIS